MKRKESTWEELSLKRNGIYERGSFVKQEKATFPYRNTSIRLEHYITMVGSTPMKYTQVRCILKNPNQMRFKIYHEGFFSSVGKILGMQDIIIGDDELDDRFVIKGNDEAMIKALLRDYKLKQLLLIGKPISIELKLKERSLKTKDESVLFYQANGTIKDIDTLDNILNIFERLVDCMIEMGFSSEEPLISIVKS